MTALPNYPNVYAISARRARISPANLTADPAEQRRELDEAAPFWTDENAPLVDLSPPPAWAARRRQMRRDGLHVIACVLGFIALIGFAITPDTAVVQAQMEDAQ